jgi:hypothetical protein
MPCPSCLSRNQAEFPAEINIHFPGPKNWTKPTLWVFPKILVCLDCGATLFPIPKDELARLGQPVEGAAVQEGNVGGNAEAQHEHGSIK